MRKLYLTNGDVFEMTYNQEEGEILLVREDDLHKSWEDVLEVNDPRDMERVLEHWIIQYLWWDDNNTNKIFEF